MTLTGLMVVLATVTRQLATSSINVPVDTNFEFSKLHLDFSQQLYVLQTRLVNASQLSDVHVNALPLVLQQQLSSNSLV